MKYTKTLSGGRNRNLIIAILFLFAAKFTIAQQTVVEDFYGTWDVCISLDTLDTVEKKGYRGLEFKIKMFKSFAGMKNDSWQMVVHLLHPTRYLLTKY